ncbi:hypothetical protein NXZ77_15535 [Lysinibacillus boronitolerans]|uniref:hypothetical protein n=1 Tax=Lysinibacillus boronitolerans TaxID=309788 RepID=UPI002161C7C1|nr:hypothetical protein [Lysinibacillus boronitolerans]MCS1392989.1 hypothetical protein [Lysinibacillus boronitolerans]
MKAPLTRFYCMSKECGFEETTHKLKEGIPCPKCKGPVLSQRVEKGEINNERTNSHNS